MADEIKSGIYEIVNLVNGKRYVGSAANLVHRWRQHRCELGKGRHNPILQRAWVKYGPDGFAFRVIEHIVDKQNLIEREQHYIDALKPEYNRAKVAGSNFGTKWSAEVKARMSAANKEVWSRPGHREKMSKAHQGQKPTPEQLAKVSAALRGRKRTPEQTAEIAARNAARNRSPEHRALISAYWKGRTRPPEHIAKMAEAKRGRPAHNKGVPMSAEQKEKQSATMRRRYEEPGRRAKTSETTRAAMQRPEVRAKLGVSKIGSKHSEETRRKMSEAHKRNWTLRKAAREQESTHEPSRLLFADDQIAG